MFKPALGSTLLLTATQCLALSLGATQGNVIIGRPLDIVVSSNIDAAEAAAGLCLEAEVMYGEMRVPASAITAAVHRLNGVAGGGALRVRVMQPVNEPFVTLTLKAGCQSSFRRSYTLLADFEAPPVPAASTYSWDVTAPAVPIAPTEPKHGDRRNSEGGGTGRVHKAPTPMPPEETAWVPETPVRLSAPVPRPVGVARLVSKHRPPDRVAAGGVVNEQASAVGAGGSRLQLDPIELPASGAASVPPSAVAGEKAAQTPQVGPAVEVPMLADRAATEATASGGHALQQQLQQLRDEQQRLRVAMESINAQLTEARGDRYQNPLVYGLSAAVLLLLAGLWRVKRGYAENDRGAAQRSKRPWWKAPAVSVSTVDSTTEDLAQDSGGTQPQVVPPQEHLHVGGIEAVETSESVFQEVPVTQVDASVLMDLWQQVDFLLSIGQAAEALQVLETFVLQHPRASEAMYLRWLQLALQQNNERALAQAQAAYESHYHRLLPAGAVTASNRLGLEDDAAFIARLGKVWPSAEAHALLCDALCSQPGAPDNALRERGLLVFEDVVTLLRVLGSLPPAAEPDIPSGPDTMVAAAVPQGSSDEAVAQWLSVEAAPTPFRSCRPQHRFAAA